MAAPPSIFGGGGLMTFCFQQDSGIVTAPTDWSILSQSGSASGISQLPTTAIGWKASNGPGFVDPPAFIGDMDSVWVSASIIGF